MKKFLLLSVAMLALSARAERLEDITIIINVRSSQPVLVAGGGSPVTYRAPVVYNGPVIYNRPVIYEGPVIYNADATPSFNCFSGYGPSFYSSGDSFYQHRYCDTYFHSSNPYCFGQSYFGSGVTHFGHSQFGRSVGRSGNHFAHHR